MYTKTNINRTGGGYWRIFTEPRSVSLNRFTHQLISLFMYHFDIFYVIGQKYKLSTPTECKWDGYLAFWHVSIKLKHFAFSLLSGSDLSADGKIN